MLTKLHDNNSVFATHKPVFESLGDNDSHFYDTLVYVIIHCKIYVNYFGITLLSIASKNARRCNQFPHSALYGKLSHWYLVYNRYVINA